MPTSRAKTASRKAASNKKASATRKARASAARQQEVFACPECGKKFSRAASLGAHRRRAHGVPGRSPRTTPTTNSKPGAVSRTTNTRTVPKGRVDRDALLRALFPDGIPARESVVRDVNGWLDQAERLARLPK